MKRVTLFAASLAVSACAITPDSAQQLSTGWICQCLSIGFNCYENANVRAVLTDELLRRGVPLAECPTIGLNHERQMNALMIMGFGFAAPPQSQNGYVTGTNASGAWKQVGDCMENRYTRERICVDQMPAPRPGLQPPPPNFTYTR